LGEHARGLASEYAHEQGWRLNEEERTRQAAEQEDAGGGRDYEYGARDFGDTAVDTSAVRPSPEAVRALLGTDGESERDARDIEESLDKGA